MQVRSPCASNFYARECNETQIEKYVKGFNVPEAPKKIIAGIVPHAGWVFSGAVAAKVFKSIKNKNNPSTFILLGANHSYHVNRNSIYSEGFWETPFGPVAVDNAIADILLKQMDGLLTENGEAHNSEHSLEVQVPLIKYFFPEAGIVPITIIPGSQSSIVGEKLSEILKNEDKEIVFIGSTDLTHYGNQYGFAPMGTGQEALKWMKQNDARIIDLAVSMKAEEIVGEAEKNHNACGSGAMAAVVSAAGIMGVKKGHLLEYTTSYDVYKDGYFDMGVGYAGIIF